VEINIPSIYRLRSLNARSVLGYVQSDLHGEDSAGWGRKIMFWNSQGEQDIKVRVRMGGVNLDKILTPEERANKDDLVASLQHRLLQTTLNGDQEKALNDFLVMLQIQI